MNTLRAMLLPLAALWMLAACAPKPPGQPAAATPSAAVSSAAASAIPTQTAAPAPERPADQAACKSAGGNWQPVCRMQKPACVMTFPDAQKACSGKADCMGACLVHGEAKAGEKAEGLCAANDDPCGCRQEVEGGIARGTLCAD
jgi:hypothetical protein